MLFLADGLLVGELTNPTQASVLEVLGRLGSGDDPTSAHAPSEDNLSDDTTSDRTAPEFAAVGA